MATQDGPKEGSNPMLANERIERLIRLELDVEPLYVEEFDISTIDLTSRKQVRDTNVAPKEQVDAYTWMMDSGDKFPAIVVCHDEEDEESEPVLGDGSTRCHAHRNRGERWTDAFVIPFNYHSVDDEMRARIDYIGGALNAKNGRPNSKKERDMLVENGIVAGKPDKEIATTAGVSVQTVANARDRAKAKQRLASLGVETSHLKDAAVSKLGKAHDVPDEVFVETVALADSAGMNAGDVASLVNSVRSAGSDETAKERIEREREQWEPRIAEVKRGNGGGVKPQAQQLRRSLGYVTKHPASAFVEHNADHAADHEDLVVQSIARLNEVLDEQREVNKELLAATTSSS